MRKLTLHKPALDDYVDVEKDLNENYRKIEEWANSSGTELDNKFDDGGVSTDYDTAKKMEDKIKFLATQIEKTPIGTILPFASGTIPKDYLLCDGREITKNDYPELYDILPFGGHIDEKVFRSLAKNEVPNMTGPTLNGYTITESSVFSATFPGWKAFDSVISGDNGGWASLTGQKEGWVQIQYPNKRALSSFTIKTRTYAPGSKLEKISVYGVTTTSEEELFTENLSRAFTTNEKREFKVNFNKKTYDKFKIKVSAPNDQYCAIDEIELFTVDITQFPNHKQETTKKYLPDLRGQFLRGIKDGRKLLDWESEDIKKHNHKVPLAYPPESSVTNTLKEYTEVREKKTIFQTLMLDDNVNDNVYGRPIAKETYEGNETRPSNIGVNYIIKAKNGMDKNYTQEYIESLSNELRKRVEEIITNSSDEAILQLTKKFKEETDKQLGILAGAGSAFKPKQVANIEILKNVNAKVDEVYEVLGYYRFDDGATHKRIISNTDDGSGVQLNNGLWANIIHSGKVNVSWFGAKGDGSDDTAFVQKALDSSAGNIFIDKECTVDDIVIKPFKDVSGVKLNAIHIEQQRNSILHNLVIKIRKTSDDNKPFWLVDKANNPGDSKLQIILENIRFVVDHERDPQNRQGFVIKNESDDGMWDIRLSKLSGDAYFKDLFVLKAGELETYGQEKYGYTWITYCKFDNISWRGSENAFKFLTYNIARGEDSYSTNRKTAPKIGDTVIQNVSVEIVPSSKTFIYAGCGAYNIKVYGTSAFTDYFRTNSYQQGRGYDYIILDNRNFFQKSGMGSRFVVDIHNGDYMAFSIRTSSGYIYPRYTWRQKFDYLKWFDVAGLSYQATDTINKANTFIFPCIFNKNAVSAGDSSCLVIAKVSLKDYYENIHLKVFSYFEDARDYTPQMYIDIAYRDNSMFAISNIKELNRLCYRVHDGIMFIYMVFDKDTNRLDNMFSYIQRTNTEIMGDMYLYSSEANMLEDNPSYKSAEKKVVTVQHKENAIAQIDTPYYARKMEKEGVLQDFDTYMDEKKAYDKQQRQLSLERQNAYEKALAINPNISYEEFMKTQPTMLMLVEEPQPSEKLKKFMEKYL